MPVLLSIIELGGYPNFAPLYRQLGYEVLLAPSVRKALAMIKSSPPDVIVAEYNYQTDFRDRTSNLETLLAVLQRLPDTRLIVFYEREHHAPLQRLRERLPIHEALPFPIQPEQLEECLRRLGDA